jgi:hypothetical protein
MLTLAPQRTLATLLGLGALAGCSSLGPTVVRETGAAPNSASARAPQQDDAEGAQRSAEDVAAELANPLAPITSLALQYRPEFGLGPDNDTNHQLRLQPSFFKPFADRSAVLVRSILPMRFNTWPTDDSGLGDLQLIPYYVPDTTAANFIGYGGAVGFDTASEDALGAGRTTAGPALIFAATGQPLTWGGLVQHVWSVDNSSTRGDVNVTTIQPFATYLLGAGWAANTSIELRQDWEAPSDSDLTVPLTLGASRVVELGGTFVNLSAAYVYYVEGTDFDPDWELRLSVTYVMR